MWPFGGGKNEASTSAQQQPPQQQTLSTAPHPTGAEASADQCPVDEKTRSVWLAQARGRRNDDPTPESSASAAHAFFGQQKARGQVQTTSAPPGLSTDRVVSSIPRFSMWQNKEDTSATGASTRSSEDDREYEVSVTAPSISDPSTSKNWVYPSPSQFYNAMARKNHNPRAEDMNTVVPIHNAVNERAWQQILAWEHLAGDGGQSVQQCGGPKLVSFKGRPKDVTWRAWWRSATGYQAPFDRHDWVIDRCGTRVTYVIDFYSGKAQQGSNVAPSLSFYLDVRPSPGQVEGVRMRAVKFLGLGYSQREALPTEAPRT